MIIMTQSLHDRTVSSWVTAVWSNVFSTHDTRRIVRITASHIAAHDVHTFISNGARSTAPYAPVTGGCRNKARLLSVLKAGHIQLYPLLQLEIRVREYPAYRYID